MFALAAAKAVAEKLGNAYNPVLIYGNPGLGKTQLPNAIFQQISEQSPDTAVSLVTTNELLSQMTNVIKTERLLAR